MNDRNDGAHRSRTQTKAKDDAMKNDDLTKLAGHGAAKPDDLAKIDSPQEFIALMKAEYRKGPDLLSSARFNPVISTSTPSDADLAVIEAATRRLRAGGAALTAKEAAVFRNVQAWIAAQGQAS
jgi:hypothetical protein